MSGRDPDEVGTKIVRAMVEGVVTAVVFVTAVLTVGMVLGMKDQLAGPETAWIIAGCGALGLFLSGRLSAGAFDDR